MSKPLKRLALAAGIMSCILFACKKSIDQPYAASSSIAIDQVGNPLEFERPHGRFSDSTAIDPTYNFLRFTNNDNYADYLAFFTGKKHKELREYMDSIGFEGLGDVLFSSYENEILTVKEVAQWAMNEDSVTEISRIVFRPISPNSQNAWDYILTMDRSNLSDYSLLASGTYKANSMNQFALGDTSASAPVLEDFVVGTPSGYQETTPVTNSFPPFWTFIIHDQKLVKRPDGCWAIRTIGSKVRFFIKFEAETTYTPQPQIPCDPPK